MPYLLQKTFVVFNTRVYFLSLFEEKLLIDDKQLLAVNLLSQNMQSEFQQAKNNFENPNTVLSRDKK